MRAIIGSVAVCVLIVILRMWFIPDLKPGELLWFAWLFTLLICGGCVGYAIKTYRVRRAEKYHK